MKQEIERGQLTLRGTIVGILGLAVITASSMYVALRMGALPWPTVFVTVVSMAVLRKAKGSTLQEINVTHTMMSAGSMVAGGLAFTLPAIWILDPTASVSFLEVLATVMCGAVLGVMFSSYIRRSLIADSSLVYPIGVAAHDTLVAGTEKGGKSVKLFVSMGASVVFTLMRDALGWIPSVINLYSGGTYVDSVSMWVSPMAVAIGAIIDRMSALLWIVGCVLSRFVIAPVGISTGLFADLSEASAFQSSLGIGIMIGTGFAALVLALVKAFGRKEGGQKSVVNPKSIAMLALASAAVAVVLGLTTGIGVLPALLAVACAFLASLMSAMMTGQSGINPMEVFGMIAMLAIGFIFKLPVKSKLIIAAVTAVACGLTGDLMNDLKSGSMLGTSPRAQLNGEGIGGVLGAVISAFVIFIMAQSLGPFGSDTLPAPQASAVASMAGGFGNTAVILVGAAIGFVLYLLHLPAATLGLGIYLSPQISISVALGTLVSIVLGKRVAKDDMNVVSSGLLGGEGITGVVIAIVSMFC